MGAVIDHLVITAATLDEGVARTEALLGVEMGPGGAHAVMGTHNRLLALGPRLYLEVIAVDPAAPAPDRARWFGLDTFAGEPRLSNWVARCDDIEIALADAPQGAGTPLSARRGDLSWRITVPDDGKLPFDATFPGLIDWDGDRHPGDSLADSGCTLGGLELHHPQAEALRAALGRFMDDPRVSVHESATPALRARLNTPRGECVLT